MQKSDGQLCAPGRGCAGIPRQVPWVKVVLKSCLGSLINSCPHTFVEKAVLEIGGAGLGCQSSLLGNPRTLDLGCVCAHGVSENGKSSVLLSYQLCSVTCQLDEPVSRLIEIVVTRCFWSGALLDNTFPFFS